ncbi:MAG: phosphoribosylaminoimidazolesuccinocarboxamide synthase [Bdellovibrionales bacterium]|nr:phosphoribosylaminoimidazolesuccinocarboxamide synthase [Bdellovibrionales bacterium]
MEKVKGELLYEGKAKKMYAVRGRPQEVWVEYKDSLTAFNAQKTGSFSGKGAINAQITALLYQRLKDNGIPTHIIENINDHEMICEKLRIIPLEVVTRNRLAGSTAKKLGKEEGTPLRAPLVEFYYKDDALGDPFISDDQAMLMGAVENRQDLEVLKTKALAINKVLRAEFEKAGLELVDFKLEFGRNDRGEIVLADEVSPDTCRLWDLKTGEKLDKDRFRRDLGRVEESYQEVLQRLKEKSK